MQTKTTKLTHAISLLAFLGFASLASTSAAHAADTTPSPATDASPSMKADTSTTTTNTTATPAKKKTTAKTSKDKKKMTTGNIAIIKTTLGTIKIKLFKDKAPKTVENFVSLATGAKEWTDPVTGKKEVGKSLYKGTIFHRVIPDFMIQ
jgi:hypothetical protein